MASASCNDRERGWFLQDKDVKERYKIKTSAIDICPYDMPLQNFSRDRMKWPEITYIDIVNYLVVGTSAYTKEQLKHYKSLEAYKFYQDDWVREVLHTEIKGLHVVKAKVTHSMRVSEKPLEPWVIIAADGSVQSAHCTCMAGLAEACSHVGAVLFCMEACARVRSKATPTDQPAYWLFPSSTKLDTQFKKIKTMDFSSPAAKRRRFEGRIDVQAPPTTDRPVVSSPTKQEEQVFFSVLHQCLPEAAKLSTTPGFSTNCQPKAVTVGLPRNLQLLFDESLTLEDEAFIRQHCLDIDLSFTPEQAQLVELQTRAQTKSHLWFEMRAGRITASNMHSACHTSTDKPSLSALKKICNPVHEQFKCAATDWGTKNEKKARSAYKEMQGGNHDSFNVQNSGLVLSAKYPAFGASPDGLIQCKCCGNGCLEIKCPYTLKDANRKIEELTFLEKGEDGTWKLSTSHQYYTQVQCQIFLTDTLYCDFVVWSPHLPLFVQRIDADSHFWEKTREKAAHFHQLCVLPELCAHMFSRRVKVLSPVKMPNNSNRFCICQGPDDGRRMIKCDSNTCVYQWFHVDCISMKRVPKGTWVCKPCKSNK